MTQARKPTTVERRCAAQTGDATWYAQYPLKKDRGKAPRRPRRRRGRLDQANDERPGGERMTQDRPAHPVADIFPMMSDDEIDALAADIRDNGLREPIWLHRDGRIIDGRNRWRACDAANVTPDTRTYEGPDEDLVKFVLSLNLHRRHLTTSQRAMVANRLATFGHGGDRVSEQAANLPLATQAEAAGLLAVSERSVRSARVVQEHGVPELVAAVDAGDVTVSQAAAVAREPEDVQKDVVKVLTQPKAEDLSTTVEVHKARDRREAAGKSVLQSISNEWYTPQRYIDAARAVMGGIDLDPASCDEANEIVKAEEYFTAEDDGLAHDWSGRVWLNPPYGGMADDFVARLLERHAQGKVTAAIALVNAHCTDSKWFWPLWDHALCFTDHRIYFRTSLDRDATLTRSMHGSVFAYLGPDRPLFRKHFAQFGAVVVRVPAAGEPPAEDE